MVDCPVAVCESGKARIVGVEWGPQFARGKADCSGWLYWLVEVTFVPPIASLDGYWKQKGGSPWAAGESELLTWAKG